MKLLRNFRWHSPGRDGAVPFVVLREDLACRGPPHAKWGEWKMDYQVLAGPSRAAVCWPRPCGSRFPLNLQRVPAYRLLSDHQAFRAADRTLFKRLCPHGYSAGAATAMYVVDLVTARSAGSVAHAPLSPASFTTIVDGRSSSRTADRHRRVPALDSACRGWRVVLADGGGVESASGAGRRSPRGTVPGRGRGSRSCSGRHATGATPGARWPGWEATARYNGSTARSMEIKSNTLAAMRRSSRGHGQDAG